MIALVGDGAMQMNGIDELITVSKYWRRRWKDPRTAPRARRARSGALAVGAVTLVALAARRRA